MTDQPEPTTIRYPSLGVLRGAHAELLRRRRAESETPALWDEAARFIADGRASGAVLDNDGERETAQSLLDYWSTLLVQAGQAETDATLHEFDPELAPELPDEPAPYVGLAAFRDGRFFFGRERLVEQMAAKLADTRLLAVVGPSGSGKSSAVLAGLIPALEKGALAGSESWRVLPRMVPGSHPLANLARLITGEGGTQIYAEKDRFEELIGKMQADEGTLARLLTEKKTQIDTEKSALINPNQRSSASSAPPAVLVVDQFEETFTLCTDEAERAAFVANLLGLAAAPGAPHRVILTMRSDYESWVSRIPALQEAFDRGRVQVLPLNAEELRRAILEPAEAVGLRFQEGIVEALISEVLGEPAALPLLQFTLRALWDNRRRNRITWDVYQRVGGGRTALALAADRLYDSLIPEEQVTARRILLRLVRPGAGLEVTSSRVAVAELLSTGEDTGRVARVLEKLLAARLLKQSEGDVAADRQVEVAHEALVRNWPQLVEWLDDERENLRQRRRLVSFFSIPVLGHIAAGEPIQVDPTDYTSADEWIDLNEALYRDRDKLFALRVQGDSMVDASVLDGDIVILRYQEKAENGEMVAAWIDGVGETTLKHFYLEGKQVRLRAANPNYKDMFFPAAQVSVKGKVVSVIRQLE